MLYLFNLKQLLYIWKTDWSCQLLIWISFSVDNQQTISPNPYINTRLELCTPKLALIFQSSWLTLRIFNSNIFNRWTCHSLGRPAKLHSNLNPSAILLEKLPSPPDRSESSRFSNDYGTKISYSPRNRAESARIELWRRMRVWGAGNEIFLRREIPLWKPTRNALTGRP